YFSCLSVINRFACLWHHAIVGCYYNNGDMRDLCSSRSHGGECFVTRRVNEGDFLPVDFDLVCADILSNTTGFTRGNFGFTNGVKQGSIAVVNVPHDGNYWRNDNRIVFVTSRYHRFVCRKSPTAALYSRSHR